MRILVLLSLSFFSFNSLANEFVYLDYPTISASGETCDESLALIKKRINERVMEIESVMSSDGVTPRFKVVEKQITTFCRKDGTRYGNIRYTDIEDQK